MDILYIPGLGEGFVLTVQKVYIFFLRLFSRKKIFVFDSRWETEETSDDKLHRLQDFYVSSGSPKIIVAPSAGGALAINLLSENSGIDAVHVICAKLQGSEKIGKRFQTRAPALKAVVRASENALAILPKDKVICYIPDNEFDGVVEREDMQGEGLTTVDLPDTSHGRAITIWLLKYLPRI